MLSCYLCVLSVPGSRAVTGYVARKLNQPTSLNFARCALGRPRRGRLAAAQTPAELPTAIATNFPSRASGESKGD